MRTYLFNRTQAGFFKLKFRAVLSLIELEHEAVRQSNASELEEYGKIRSWADLYDGCSFEAKKMIAAQFIKAVYVHRDYKLEVKFNVSFDEFKSLSIDESA